MLIISEHCSKCGKEVHAKQFKEQESIRRYYMSGECEECQQKHEPYEAYKKYMRDRKHHKKEN
jgi:hypothetical protein